MQALHIRLCRMLVPVRLATFLGWLVEAAPRLARLDARLLLEDERVLVPFRESLPSADNGGRKLIDRIAVSRRALTIYKLSRPGKGGGGVKR